MLDVCGILINYEYPSGVEPKGMNLIHENLELFYYLIGGLESDWINGYGNECRILFKEIWSPIILL